MRGKGEHQEGRCKRNGRGRQKEGRSSESDVYLKKKEIATFCREDLDKLKGHSILERQLEWRKDTEQAQCWEQVCRNVPAV